MVSCCPCSLHLSLGLLSVLRVDSPVAIIVDLLRISRIWSSLSRFCGKVLSSFGALCFMRHSGHISVWFWIIDLMHDSHVVCPHGSRLGMWFPSSSYFSKQTLHDRKPAAMVSPVPGIKRWQSRQTPDFLYGLTTWLKLVYDRKIWDLNWNDNDMSPGLESMPQSISKISLYPLKGAHHPTWKATVLFVPHFPVSCLIIRFKYKHRRFNKQIQPGTDRGGGSWEPAPPPWP